MGRERLHSWETKDSGARSEYGSGMVRDTEEGKPRFDLIRPLGVPYEQQMLTRFAALMARGAAKYNARNWEKADSEEELKRYYSSAARHFEQWLAGEQDEDHAAAVYFNIMAAETLKYKLEVNNGGTNQQARDAIGQYFEAGAKGPRTEFPVRDCGVNGCTVARVEGEDYHSRGRRA